MIDLDVAAKIISVFFREIVGFGNADVEMNEESVFVSAEDVKVLKEKAYMYCAHYFDNGTLYIQIAFESNLFDPDTEVYGALNGYNSDSTFWKATIERGDICFRCYVYAVETENALAETLAVSFWDLKRKDNGECLKKLLSYINY